MIFFAFKKLIWRLLEFSELVCSYLVKNKASYKIIAWLRQSVNTFHIIPTKTEITDSPPQPSVYGRLPSASALAPSTTASTSAVSQAGFSLIFYQFRLTIFNKITLKVPRKSWFIQDVNSKLIPSDCR